MARQHVGITKKNFFLSLRIYIYYKKIRGETLLSRIRHKDHLENKGVNKKDNGRSRGAKADAIPEQSYCKSSSFTFGRVPTGPSSFSPPRNKEDRETFRGVRRWQSVFISSETAEMAKKGGKKRDRKNRPAGHTTLFINLETASSRRFPKLWP